MKNIGEKIPSEESRSEVPEKRYWKLISEEPAWISAVNPENPVDFERYKQLDRSPETQEWMIGEPLTEEEIKKLLASHPGEQLLYAVSGEKGGGDLEGWVQFVPEEKERIGRLKEMGLADIPEDHLTLELSYARYKNPDAPGGEGEKGLISSGVRQICYSLGLNMTKEDEEAKASKKPLLKPGLTIVAYTNPANEPSEWVLKRSGFQKLGKIPYEPGDEKLDNVWILDWNKLRDRYVRIDEKRMKGEEPQPEKEQDELALLADRLDELQKEKNQGRGVDSVRTVIAYLRNGDVKKAKAVCLNEHDKIGSYPDIMAFLETELFK